MRSMSSFGPGNGSSAKIVSTKSVVPVEDVAPLAEVSTVRMITV
jgi:hypothetical protein